MTLKVNVVHDHEPQNPRDNDCNLGTIVGQKGYGDEQLTGNYESMEDEAKATAGDKATILPVYIYQHGNVALSTESFHGRVPGLHAEFDSALLGFIYVSDSLARTLLGWKSITKGRREDIKKYLRQEVEAYSKYLNGEAYGYEVVDEEGEVVESCYGYDDEDYCRKEGELAMKALVKAEV